MQNPNRIGADNEKGERLKLLKKQLGEQMTQIRDERDVEKIEKIMLEIKELQPLVHDFSPEESLAEFHQIYSPKAEHDRRELENLKKEVTESSLKRENALLAFRRFKAACVIATTVVCLNFVSIVVAGVNIFEPFIHWTDNIFSKRVTPNMESPPIINDALDQENIYHDFESIEDKYDITVFKPQYIPEGYLLEHIEKLSLQSRTHFFASYKNNDKEIVYDFLLLNPTNVDYTLMLEKTEENPEIYRFSGIDYYILKNTHWFTISWDYMNIEYTASGFETREEVINFVENLIL